jgi:tRNA-Thr(GGU) m(6)t(6)A37 methyltransferase TsaA
MDTAKQFVFRQIGVVRTKATDNEVKEKPEQLEATVEVFAEFQEALEGIDGFSHIFVLSYLNRLRPEQIGPLKVKPRRFLRAGFKAEEVPLVGVFSIESPTRPNPIGLSLVRLIRREGRILFVEGMDVFNGTPVLDIKPYTETYRANPYQLAEWNQELLEKIDNQSN